MVEIFLILLIWYFPLYVVPCLSEIFLRLILSHDFKQS